MIRAEGKEISHIKLIKIWKISNCKKCQMKKNATLRRLKDNKTDWVNSFQEWLMDSVCPHCNYSVIFCQLFNTTSIFNFLIQSLNNVVYICQEHITGADYDGPKATWSGRSVLAVLSYHRCWLRWPEGNLKLVFIWFFVSVFGCGFFWEPPKPILYTILNVFLLYKYNEFQKKFNCSCDILLWWWISSAA